MNACQSIGSIFKRTLSAGSAYSAAILGTGRALLGYAQPPVVQERPEAIEITGDEVLGSWLWFDIGGRR